MSFWGMEVKGGAPALEPDLNKYPSDIVHLSQACLANPKPGRNVLKVTHLELKPPKEYTIATLEMGKAEHVTLDLFATAGTIKISCEGKSAVHLSGYVGPLPGKLGEDSEEEEEEEEEMEPSAKKRKTANAFESSEEEDDGEEEEEPKKTKKQVQEDEEDDEEDVQPTKVKKKKAEDEGDDNEDDDDDDDDDEREDEDDDDNDDDNDDNDDDDDDDDDDDAGGGGEEKDDDEDDEDDDDDEDKEDEGPRSSPPRRDLTDGRKCFVGGLDYEVDEEALTKYLTKKCGDVEEVHLPRDRDTNKAKGFAFVTFGTAKSAAKCVELNGEEYTGRFLKVNMAENKPTFGKGGKDGKGKGKSKDGKGKGGKDGKGKGKGKDGKGKGKGKDGKGKGKGKDGKGKGKGRYFD